MACVRLAERLDAEQYVLRSGKYLSDSLLQPHPVFALVLLPAGLRVSLGLLPLLACRRDVSEYSAEDRRARVAATISHVCAVWLTHYRMPRAYDDSPEHHETRSYRRGVAVTADDVHILTEALIPLSITQKGHWS